MTFTVLPSFSVPLLPCSSTVGFVQFCVSTDRASLFRSALAGRNRYCEPSVLRPVTVRPSTRALTVPSSSDGANAPSGSVVTLTSLE